MTEHEGANNGYRMSHQAAPVGLYHEVDAVTTQRPTIPPKEPLSPLPPFNALRTTTPQPQTQDLSPPPPKAGAYSDEHDDRNEANEATAIPNPSPRLPQNSPHYSMSPYDTPNPLSTQQYQHQQPLQQPQQPHQQQPQYQQQLLHTQQQQQQLPQLGYQAAPGVNMSPTGYGSGAEQWRASAQSYQTYSSDGNGNAWTGAGGAVPMGYVQQGQQRADEPQDSMTYKPQADYSSQPVLYPAATFPVVAAPYQPQYAPNQPIPLPQGRVELGEGAGLPGVIPPVAIAEPPNAGAGKRKLKICGMQKSVFILIMVIALFVVIGALVGGILGGVVYKQKGDNNSNQQNENNLPTKTTSTTTIRTSTIRTKTTTSTAPARTIPSYVYPLPTGTWTVSAPLAETLIDGSCLTNKTAPDANSTAVWFCEARETYTFEIRDLSVPNSGELLYSLSMSLPVAILGVPGSPPTGTSADVGATAFWTFSIEYKQTVQKGCSVDVHLGFLLGRTKSIFGWYRDTYSNSVCQLTNGKTSTAGLYCGCGYLFTA